MIERNKAMALRLKMCFQFMDKDGNGTVNLHEMAQTLEQDPTARVYFGLRPLQKHAKGTQEEQEERIQIERAFSSVDADQSCGISFEEFLAAGTSGSLTWEEFEEASPLSPSKGGRDPEEAGERSVPWESTDVFSASLMGAVEKEAHAAFDAIEKNAEHSLTHEELITHLTDKPWALEYNASIKPTDITLWESHEKQLNADIITEADFVTLYMQKIHPMMMALEEAANYDTPIPYHIAAKLAGAAELAKGGPPIAVANAAGNAARLAALEPSQTLVAQLKEHLQVKEAEEKETKGKEGDKPKTEKEAKQKQEATATTKKQKKATQMKQLFNSIDGDANHNVSKKEIIAALKKDPRARKQLGLPSHKDVASSSQLEQELNAWFEKFDSDHSSELSWKELSRIAKLKPADASHTAAAANPFDPEHVPPSS